MRLPTHRTMLSAAAATSILLLTAACGGSDSAGGTADSSTSAPSATDEASGGDTSGDAAGTYTDGDYEGEGSYQNPGGTSSVTVSLTLADGAVSEIEVEPGASGTSLQYQEQFIGGIADEVVGKSLDEISVSKVAGSSLTSQGFNDALEQIKSDAQA